MDNQILLVEQEKSEQILKEEAVAVKTKSRGSWANDREFFLACLGYCVGLANIWRFPYLCYKNGGGAFLIPYLLVAAIAAMPMYTLEVALGQFTRKGAIGAFDLVPVMRGVGVAFVIICLYSSFYYVMVIAWGMLYFTNSFTTGILPWSHCNNSWNTESCISYKDIIDENFTASTNASTLSVTEFWSNRAIRISDGLHDVGTTQNWPLLLCYIASWVLCYFCIFRGVKSTGKVVYFTAIFPYLILTILVVRTCMLEGATEGLKFYLIPNLKKLTEFNVWVDAASQVLYSYGPGFTVLITFGSYNRLHNDCYKYCITLASCCSLTSVFAGLCVFSVLGHLAHMTHGNVSDVVTSGAGLAFQTYPLAISLLPAPQLWAILFFFVIVIVGIDSQFTCVEGLVAAIHDIFPHLLKNKLKPFLPLILCAVLMVVGIPMTFGFGIYIFELFNNYACIGFCLFTALGCEAVTIAYLYGMNRFLDDMKMMIGYYPNSYLKICFRFFVPVVCLITVLYQMFQYRPLVIYGYEYPPWANAIGWGMAISSVINIPIIFMVVLWKADGESFLEKWRSATKPRYGNHLKMLGNSKYKE